MKLSPNRLSVFVLMCLSLCAGSVIAQASAEPETASATEASTSAAVADASASASKPALTPAAESETGGVTINGRYFPPPMTGKERWDKYVKDTFTGFPIYAASLGAALGDQASNTPNPHFSQALISGRVGMVVEPLPVMLVGVRGGWWRFLCWRGLVSRGEIDFEHGAARR